MNFNYRKLVVQRIANIKNRECDAELFQSLYTYLGLSLPTHELVMVYCQYSANTTLSTMYGLGQFIAKYEICLKFNGESDFDR